ncbi:MAG: hypothetical protein ACXWNK_13650 [Vulcanimicrobiaceae bacterium]
MVGTRPSDPPVTLELRTGEEPVTLTIGDGEVRSTIGSVKEPDGVISGPAREIARVLFIGRSLAAARKRGVTYKGDRKVFARLKR